MKTAILEKYQIIQLLNLSSIITTKQPGTQLSMTKSRSMIIDKVKWGKRKGYNISGS